MRISNQMMQRLAVNAMNDRQTVLSETQLQLASGKKIIKPSDNPGGATQILLNNQKLALNEQYQTNASRAVSRLESEEAVLASAGNNLQRVRELAVQALNDPLGASNRANIADEVWQRLDELLDMANTKDAGGEYIFAGFQGKTVPFVDAGGGVFNFQGDQGQRMVQISATRQTAITDSGADIFLDIEYSGGGKQNIFKTLYDFATALEANLPTDYVNGTTQYNTSSALGQQGSGVDNNALATGDLSISIGSAPAVAVGASVDNSVGAGNAGRTAGSAYSKTEAINNAGISGLTATADTTVVMDFVAVTDTASTYTLEINGQPIYTAEGNAISGPQMAAAINANTGATGVSASFDNSNRMILSAPDGRNISISQTTGVGAAGLGQGLTTTTSVGSANNSANDALDVTTTAPGVAASNTFVGTIRLSSPTSISLSGANESRIGYTDNAVMDSTGDILTDLDAALDKLFSKRAEVGSRINTIESQQQINEQYTIQLKSALSSIEDLDYAEAIARMNLQLVGLQAAQQSYQMIQNLSLFNYMR